MMFVKGFFTFQNEVYYVMKTFKVDINLGWQKIMRIPRLGLVLHRGVALRAPLRIGEHWLHFSTSIKHRDSFSTVIHSIQVFGFYGSGLWDWGTINGTQTGISIIHSNLLQNLRKIHISSSLSCNSTNRQLDSALSPTW